MQKHRFISDQILKAFSEIKCPGNYPITFFCVSQNCSSNQQAMFCNQQTCTSCKSKKLRKASLTSIATCSSPLKKISPINTRQCGKENLINAQALIEQIMKKYIPLAQNQTTAIQKTLQWFNQMIDLISHEKAKLQKFRQYNGLTEHQTSLIETIKNQNKQKRLTHQFITKIKKQLNQVIKYKYQEMEKRVETGLLMDLKDKLSHYYSKKIQFKLINTNTLDINRKQIPSSIFLQLENIDLQYYKEENQRNHRTYFGQSTKQQRYHFDLQDNDRDWFQFDDNQAQWKQNKNQIQKFVGEEQFNTYQDDYDYDYLETE